MARGRTKTEGGHDLADGETIVAKNEAGDIAVTSEGRKVRLEGGKVQERLTGPEYDWEAEDEA